MVHRGGRGRGRGSILTFLVSCAFAGGLFAAAPAAGAPAWARDVFTVAHVGVDVTAEAAASAREAALLEGQRKAFRRLLRRLTRRRDHAFLPTRDDAEILEFVRGIEVEEEKASTVRYLAQLTIRFKPDAIRDLLRSAGISFAETISKPVLVLPVYEAGGTLSLWDDPNPWRDAWIELGTGDGLVPLVAPLGDLADVAEISAEQAARAVRDRLEAIAHRYGAADTLVAVASLTSPGMRPTIDVAVARLGPAILERTVVLSFAAAADETVDDLLHRAARQVAAQVEESWKRDNLLRFDREETLSVAVPLTVLRDWLEVRRRLGGIAFIRAADLMALSRSEATVKLRYIGDIGQLRLALAQSDLDLSQGPVSWVLRLEKGGPLNAAR